MALIGQDGTTVLEYAYSAFGEAYSKSGTGNFAPIKETGPLLGNSRLFAGREFDAETGFYYVRARTYSPELGRFLQRDPVGQNDQVNPYAYVANNPLGYVDPTGREKAMIVIGQEKRYKDSFGNPYIGNQTHSMADYQRKQLQNMGYRDGNIRTMDYNEVDNVSDILRTDYDLVVIAAHGNSDSVFISINMQIDRDSLTSVGPMCSKQEIYLAVCNAGNGSDSIAQDVSNRTGSKVTAPNGFLIASDPFMSTVTPIKDTFPFFNFGVTNKLPFINSKGGMVNFDPKH